jgi:DNA-binding winged helix-turn-helix (wHTH) protein/predicted ATPase
MGGLAFGAFVLDPSNAELRRADGIVPLTPKAFSVLRHLAERPGQLVTKDELLAAIWAGTHVSDGVLKVCVLEVRRALADDADSPQYIETIPRRGYRFVARSRLVGDTDHATGLVGRDDVLRTLDECLERAAIGQRQLLFVTGEAGIGKTAVLDAFLASAASNPRLWVARGQAHDQHGAGEPYQPILDALGRLARDAAHARLVELLQSHAPTWLAQLPWLVTDPMALRLEVLGTGRGRMLRELAELLEAVTREVVLVLAFEDLHWSDPSTVTALAALAGRSDPARLLVVGTYRPVELILADHPLRAIERELRATGRARILPLEFLPEVDVTTLIRRRLASSALAGSLGPIVHRRTDGNPLFVVNLLEYLTTQGHLVQADGTWRPACSVAELETVVPDDLRGMIERQIERCSPDEQALLETASVGGMAFGVDEVAAGIGDEAGAIEARCETIASRTLLIVRAPAEAGGATSRYAFAHALYQQVLLERVPPVRRARLHLGIAEHVERALGPRAAEQAAALARHFELGGEARRALDYYRQAADTAAQRVAFAEALAHLANAERLLPSVADGEERKQIELLVQIARGPSLMMTRGWAAPEVLAAFGRARELLWELGDPVHLFPVLWGLWAFNAVRGDLAAAAELADECLARATASGDDGLRLEAHHAQWVTRFFRGDFVGAWEHLEAGLALHDPGRDGWHVMVYGTDPGVAANAYAGIVLLALGRLEEAAPFTRASIALADRIGHPVSKVFAVNFEAWAADIVGDAARCETLAEENLARATRLGLELWHAHATCFRGISRAATALDAGIEEHRRGLASLEATGARMGLPSYQLTLAILLGLRAGHIDEARDTCALARRTAEETSQHYWTAEIRRIEGELALAAERARHPDRPPTARAAREAETAFREALERAHDQGARALEMRAAVSLARLYRSLDRAAQARDVLGPVLRAMGPAPSFAEVVEARALHRALGGRLPGT